MRASAFTLPLLLAGHLGCESERSGDAASRDSFGSDIALVDDESAVDVVAVPDDTAGGGAEVVVPEADAEADAESADIGAAPVGACLNGDDLNGLQAKDPRATVQECAQKCMSEAGTGCATTCIEDMTPLSEPCAACFGGIIECLYARCGTECADGVSPDCDACTLSQGCVAEFTACSGISPPK